jgi:murein DD-endopeptidase MepM/ murein hydrolase activator NlpD
MNLALLLRMAVSLKTEAKIVLVSLAVLLFLPIFAVVAIAASGLQAVSDALAWLNPETHKVEIRNPAGDVMLELDATTAWPTTGTVTQEFGIPNLPYEEHHSGLDIANVTGTPITPFMPGRVIKAGPVTEGCGQCVYVDHGNHIVSTYSHMSVVKAKVGDEVKPGDVIGLQGETGWAEGSHLHFTIKLYDIPVNPRIFMVGEPVLN